MKDKSLTPLRAIRAKCLDCVGKKPSLVRKCDSESCALHLFRFGKNPSRKGIGGSIGLKTFDSGHKNSISVQDSDANKQSIGNIANEPLKLVPSEEMAISGSGDFNIKKTDKGFIIRLTKA